MLPVQSSSPLSSGDDFKTFMKDEMKCNTNVIKALKDYQGVTSVEEFEEFASSEWDGIGKQFLSPPMKKVSNVLEKQSPIVITAISMKRLKAASCAVRYYVTCGYDLTVENMKWICVEEIYEVMKAFEESKADASESLPKLTRDSLFPIWLEKHLVQLDTKVGKRFIPLSYLLREKVIPNDVNGVPPGLLVDKPYAEEYGSVEMTLIERANHSHALYAQDDRKLFDLLSAAWCNTGIETCIAAQTQRSKKGRELFLQAKKEFAGANKWLEIVSYSEKQLTTLTFNGNGTKYGLLNHIQRHRAAHAKLLSASKQSNISFVLPDESTRVRYFLASIETCLDQKLISRIESVKSDDVPGGKNNDFDLCVQYLLPACPVYHRRQKEGKEGDPTENGGTKRKTASVSDVGKGVTDVDIKKGRGKSGVDFRWHSKEDFHALPKAQKDELCAWRRTPEGKRSMKAGKGKKNGTTGSKKFKKALAAAIKSHKEKSELYDEKQMKFATEIAAAFSELPSPPNASGATRGRDPALDAKVFSVLKSNNVRFDEA